MTVVVPAHAAAAALPACLDGLRAQTLEADRFEAIVVASAEDGVAGLVGSAGFTYLEHPGPGPADRRNAGAARARGRVLAFLDADCAPEPGWLEAGLEAIEGGAEVVQGRVTPPEGQPLSPFGHQIWVTGPSPRYESCNILYARELFDALGGFPTHLFEQVGEPFGEDALLGVLARRAGARIEFSERAAVRHEASPPDLERHLREQLRLRHYPALAREAPELRRAMLCGLFLGPRTLAGWALVAALLGPRTLRRPLAAAYLGHALLRRPRRTPLATVRNLPLHALSDLVAIGALAWGSIRHRTPVL